MTALQKAEAELRSVQSDIYFVNDEIDTLENKREDLHKREDELEGKIKALASGEFNDVRDDVRDRCAALEGTHLTGAEQEAIDDLLLNDKPGVHDLGRLKTIELNHLPETVFSGTCGHSVPSMRACQ